MKENILEKTAREYYLSGIDELSKERYNSSVVLFFKALVSLIDLYIFNKKGKTPSSHGERFRITESLFPEVYDILDKDFPFYQESYVHMLSRELAEVIKEDAEKIAEKCGIKLL
ncbi:hypothetical protein HYZ97_02605 [Candidatus Pacearchaeota archaeon]|nr:hypothetical protein [Candidatus Pacearchaeota archaeon]